MNKSLCALKDKIEPFSSEPIVSVCCTTFQHANFISDAIEGFLKQKVNFPVEIIIRDDASKDGTSEIVKEYADKYPNVIRAILEPENTWSKGVRPMGTCMSYAQGKYIAPCEGDDYWTDPLKLQKQVDFMEENPDCTLCSHHYVVQFLKSNKEAIEYVGKFKEGGIYDGKKVIAGVFIRIVTMMFRKADAQQLPEWISQMPYGDLPLQLHLASKGKIGILGGYPMAVYRRGVQGAWSNNEDNGNLKRRLIWQKKRYETHLLIFNAFNSHTDYKFDKQIQIRKKNFLRYYWASIINFYNKKQQISIISKHFSIFFAFRQKTIRLFWAKVLLGRKGLNWVKSVIKLG